MGSCEGRKAHIVKYPALLLTLLATAACATSGGLQATGPGTSEITSFAVLHDGPEIAVIVVHPSAKRSLGEEWLALAIEVTANQGSGPVILKRGDLSLRTPAGRRLKLISQDEFRNNYPRLQIPVARALANLPLLDRYKPGRYAPCDRWFFVAPPQMLALDEIPFSSSQICSGPLIFEVSGGIQPGRWRLIIELQESRADIPFMLELEE